jgi:hypothetical protein
VSVLVSIEPSQLQVVPGAEATLVLRVRNRGSIVDRFDLSVVGPTSGWVQVDPPSLRLFPDQEAEARITFRPPRGPSPIADTYPFGVAIRAAADPDATTVEEGRITVAPFVELTTGIVPQTSRGSRSGSHEVTVHNNGNSVGEVTVSASDPDRLLRFEVTPASLGLKPAASMTVRARAIPKDTFFTGTPKRLPFTVQVDEPTAGSLQVQATLEQRPILPSWLKPVAGLAVAAIAAMVVLPGVLGFDAPWPHIAQATLAPTPLVTPAPTPTPPPPPTDAPATAEVTPVPTFGPPDDLVWAGFDGTLAPESGLILRCPKGDETCADNAWDHIAVILDNLKNKADGALLVSFNSTPVGTLPVTASWDNVKFEYAAVDGTGLTNKIAIDLAPYIGGGLPYALVSGSDGKNHVYVISSADAKLLFDILYELPVPVPTPAPTPTGGILVDWRIDYGILTNPMTGTPLSLQRFVSP